MVEKNIKLLNINIMYEFIIKSPQGRVVVVASRQKFKYIKVGYVCIGKLNMQDEYIKHLIKKGYTKEEIVSMSGKVKLIKRTQHGKEHFFAI